jgi:chorismate mutase
MLNKLILLSVALVSFHSFSAPNPETLFQDINKRLSYMEDVALYKANHHLLIEDVARETFVIEKAVQSAEKVGLNGNSIANFFQKQIGVAKAIQYRYRADLLNQSVVRKPRDLKMVIRPELIRLGKQINKDIYQYLNEGGKLTDKYWRLFEATLDTRYLSKADKRSLFNALTQIKLQ